MEKRLNWLLLGVLLGASLLVHAEDEEVIDDMDDDSDHDDFDDGGPDVFPLQDEQGQEFRFLRTRSLRSGGENERPIIGILAQKPGKIMREALARHNIKGVESYIAASYVKSFESAGARVVPIMINKKNEYYRNMTSKLNGIVFPGGGAAITNKNVGYGGAARRLYKGLVEQNDKGNTMPLFGICLGFEILMHIASGVDTYDKMHILDHCKAKSSLDTLQFTEGLGNSRLFATMSNYLLGSIQFDEITSNFHKYCVTPKKFATKWRLVDDYDIVSTTNDTDNLVYISTVEHKRYPIFGTQWHPEKAAYEWRKLRGIPRSMDAIMVNDHFMKVFGEQVRKNKNTFSTPEEEDRYLIYNHCPVDIQRIYRSSFNQVYFFNKTVHDF